MDFFARSTNLALGVTLGAILIFGSHAFAADSIKGQVLGGGAPIAQSTVTLWAASADAPKQLAETKTDNEGRFELTQPWSTRRLQSLCGGNGWRA